MPRPAALARPSAAIAEVQERYGRFARDEAPGRSALYEEWAAWRLGRRRHRRDPGAHPRDATTAAAGVRRDASARGAARTLRRNGRPGSPLTPTRSSPKAHGAVSRPTSRCAARRCCPRSARSTVLSRCSRSAPVRDCACSPTATPTASRGSGMPRSTRPMAPRASSSRASCEARRRGRHRCGCPTSCGGRGIDLAPLDARDDSDRRFLTTLVWPGEEGRAQRIEAALDVVAADPPEIVRGDATDPAVLASMIGRAPRDATLVITTPGVLPYIPRADRDTLIAALTAAEAVWITIDPPTLHEAWHPSIDISSWDGLRPRPRRAPARRGRPARGFRGVAPARARRPGASVSGCP